MLAFANTMFLDLLHEDGLLVAAKGLGIEEVFYSLLRVYCDPGNLVLVMGTDEDEEDYFTKRLEKDDVKTLPKKVTTEYSIPDRQKLYLDGGVLFVTTRILVVDMLTDRMPMSLITGILVYKAHKTLDSCQESFVLRLYRQKNKTGFVKAFSSSPDSFKTGLCDMTRLMKSLYIKEMYLWPRFHVSVVESLSACTPDVIELHIDMTEKMRTIQTCVLDLISFSLSELKRINPHLLVDELTIENAISRTFHKLLLRELEPIWHRLSWKTKQLVTDIKTLHSILVHLTQYDCVTFHIFVAGLKTTENAMRSAGWMLLDAAETLFLTAKARVYGSSEGGKSSKKAKIEETSEAAGAEELFDFDANPKWSALSEIVTEIRTELAEKDTDDQISEDKILILTSDQRVAHQLEDFLYLGSEGILTRMINRTIACESLPEKRELKHKGRGKKSGNVDVIADRGDLGVGTDNDNATQESPHMPTVKSLQVGTFNIYKLLEDLQPRYVILYDVQMSVVRQLEIYQAKNPHFKVKVYFLMYGNSVEEQAYLSSLRREKESFEFLIREKSSLVMPEIIEDFEPESESLGAQSNAVTRKAGGSIQSDKPTPKVIVDMREFRSELPSILHKRGIQVDPVTLEVGDYILTPEICVERKSISDLIGSLNCGRLYNQATAMSRYYAKPMLLIEFDQNKPFALQGKYYLSKDISSSDITARLQLLTIHFPKLRILWSPSPHATGELIEELKKGREEPDPDKAAGVTIDAVDEFNTDKYNPNIMDFLSKLPGVTTKNIFALMNQVEDFSDLLSRSLEDLTDILGHSANAQELYNGLHEVLTPLGEESTSQKSKAKGSRFKTNKNKVPADK